MKHTTINSFIGKRVKNQNPSSRSISEETSTDQDGYFNHARVETGQIRLDWLKKHFCFYQRLKS
ncbi:hypothetical protein Hanom_Chr01g00009011 [Helianthus anomalus]